MKILLTHKKKIAVLGFVPNQNPINVRSLLSLVVCAVGVASSGIYLFCEANSFREYATSVFVCTIIIGVTVTFIIIISKTRAIFDFLTGIEVMIDGSKFEYFFTLFHKYFFIFIWLYWNCGKKNFRARKSRFQIHLHESQWICRKNYENFIFCFD